MSETSLQQGDAQRAARDGDVLYRLVREMVLLHNEGNLSQEEHEWAEEQWVFKALTALTAIASGDELTIAGILSSYGDAS